MRIWESIRNLWRRGKKREKQPLSVAKPQVGAHSVERPATRAPESLRPFVPRRKQPKTVVVGIDFGTSGTKIVFGDTTSDRHYLVSFGESADGALPFILPSVVRLKGENLLFHSDDSAEPSDLELRAFKVCLACQLELALCRQCAYRSDRPGVFVRQSDHVTAEEVATWYLAYVIGLCKREMNRRWGGGFELRPLYNIGAPIDQWNAHQGKELFTRVAFYAERLSDTVVEGMTVADIRASYAQIRSSNSALPGEKEQNVFVQPETAAGLMSFVTSPRVPAGLYGIVDVGAGTTDVSFFRLADFTTGEPRRMSFYDAKTDVVGSGDLDRSLARIAATRIANLSDGSPELLRAARIAKERLDAKGGCEITVASGSAKFSRPDINDCFAPVLKQMVQTYVQTNHRAYKKENLVKRWEEFTVIPLGGGMRCPPVLEGFQATYPSTYNKRIKFSPMVAPPDFECNASAKYNFNLVAVAYGLSFSPLDFPEILSPSAVAPMDFNLPTRHIADRDEQYPK